MEKLNKRIINITYYTLINKSKKLKTTSHNNFFLSTIIMIYIYIIVGKVVPDRRNIR